MKQTYYKAVRMDRTAFYDKETKWGTNMPVIEDPDSSENGPCGRGYHLAKSIPDVFQGIGFPLRLAEAEPLSPILGEDKGKVRVAHAKIVRWIPQKEWPNWLRKTQKFLNSLNKVKWFENHGSVDPKWKIFETRAEARDAKCDTARNAWYIAFNVIIDVARNAAADAAYDATRDAARFRVYDAVYDAWKVTYSAVRNATNDLAYFTAKEAARDAVLMARLLVCDGLNLDPKHLQQAKDRWKVWTRGYGLFADVDGVLYVYKKL